jgi:UDP-GlcNAc:undecaprenyl-phosphate GlcNAc-1-phosphate transferase
MIAWGQDLTVGSLSFGVLAALAVGLALQPLVVRLMLRHSVLDLPSDRSSHTVPIPRGGGVAVTLAIGGAIALMPPARPFLLPLLAFATIGLVEDLRGLPIPVRLFLQLVTGAVTAMTLLPLRQPMVLIVLAMAVWLSGFVNGFNFMDGINGISAVSAIVGGLAYAWLGIADGVPVLTAVGAVTFLPYNAGRARIFLGDVGSYALGGTLGSLAVYAVLNGAAVEAALAPLFLYLADSGLTLLRRMYRCGWAFFRPHRTHVYQRLTTIGLSHQQVAVAVGALSAVVSVCAMVGSHGSIVVRVALDAVVVGVLLTYLASPPLLAGWLHRRAESRVVPEGLGARSDAMAASVGAPAA